MSEDRHIISVKVVPRASKDSVAVGKDTVVVKTTAPANDGQANKAVIALLAQELGVPKSKLRIARGAKSRYKQVQVLS
jgi:uncharacterized protein (TIGR00251 family)